MALRLYYWQTYCMFSVFRIFTKIIGANFAGSDENSQVPREETSQEGEFP